MSVDRRGYRPVRLPKPRPAAKKVQVINCQTPAEDWPAWTPIAVAMPDSSAVQDPAAFWKAPTFPGYRFDNATIGTGTCSVMLGITQVPIASGGTGDVAIAGLTPALIQKCPSDHSWGGSRDWVHVRKEGSRWTLRHGAGGDAKFVQYLTYELFEDGVYNDQELGLIDLCAVPNRVQFRNVATGQTIPMHSIVHCQSPHVAKLPSTNVGYVLHQVADRISGTCGWDVPPYGWGWAYRIDTAMPVCVACASKPAANVNWLGPAGDSFVAWQDLPGFWRVSDDWYKYGENFYAWVTKDFRPFRAKMNDTGAAFAISGGYPCDGQTRGGLTYPIVQADVDFPDKGHRSINLVTDQEVRVTLDPARGNFIGDPCYLDDPIGTVKIWMTDATPPQGWRECAALEGRFPVGLQDGDTDFGTLENSGGSRTHTHNSTSSQSGSSSAASTASASHLPPYHVVRFIERYQP